MDKRQYYNFALAWIKAIKDIAPKNIKEDYNNLKIEDMCENIFLNLCCKTTNRKILKQALGYYNTAKGCIRIYRSMENEERK